MFLDIHRGINFLIIISIIFFSYFSFSVQDSTPKRSLSSQALAKNTYYIKQEYWADSILNTMTLDEKIGQLFMVSAFSNRNEYDYSRLENQVKKYHLGGIIFFQGNAAKQVELTNRYQAASKIPLLIGIDAEWGLGMRLNESISFPKAITIGATNNPEIAKKIGFNIGEQCKRLGININFAPDADLNSNPKNPVINYRSFGEAPAKVADLAVAYNRGLRGAKVMGSAKHFPGHGDTDVDSHRELPVLNHSKYTLDELDTYPFKRLIDDSVASVMIGHLYVPALEDQRGVPASVSKKVVNDYLKRDLSYDGLVVTDALNMRGLLRYFPTGEAEVKAFEAGNDLLLQTGNLEIAFNKLKERFADSTLSVLDLNIKVKKILKSKYWVGLNKYKPSEYSELAEDLNLQEAQGLKREVFENAITITKNTDNILPIANIGNKSIASIAISAPEDNEFQKYLSLNTEIKNFNLVSKPQRPSDWTSVVEKAAKNDIVIVSIHDMHNLESKNYGVSNETIEMLNSLSRKTKVIVCVFGNPYSLKLFSNYDNVICGYEDEPEAQWAMANIVFGVKGATGKIPVNTLSETAKLGSGISTESLGKLDYSTARAMGFNPIKLNKIRNIVYQSIQDKEFPGCQVLVARKGKVIFYESFGNLRYNVVDPVTKQTIFDIASLSKVSATVQAIMMLYDQKQIDLNQKISYYLPEIAQTNKRNITVRDLLLHQSGLKAFIPFWTRTKLPDKTFMPEYYVDSSFAHLNVTPKLCIIPSIKDSVYKWILESPINTGPPKYVYSDLGLILLQHVVEAITKKPLDVFVSEKLYKPIGMPNTGYNIYKFRDAKKVAPTEIDNLFRNEEIQGSVHDQNAALVGGVAGHAGLFTNAWDLAKLLQMNLNMGKYGGEKYFSPETINYFTKRQSDISHRGLGWNKPSPGDGSISEYASPNTYGHTGFTGTAAWVDPDKELIYIFLSNRVYPNAENNLILKNKTRKRIHDAIYQAME